jgi:LysM repeat protein
MKRLFALLLLIISIYSSAHCFELYLIDSVGIKSEGNSKYIVHEVDAGETLFALSRKYQISVDEIRKANTSSLTNLDIGQTILIPVKEKQVDDNAIIHEVKSSETLFSISRSYNVTVDELKEWNSISGNSISVGQKLRIEKPGPSETSGEASINVSNRKTHVVQESQTLYSISRMYDVSTEQIKEWNSLASNSLSIGQTLIVSASSSETATTESNSSMLPTSENKASVVQPSTDQSSGQLATGDAGVAATSSTISKQVPVSDPAEEVSRVDPPAEKVVQRGMAEVIEDTQNTKKYLALHRNAPMGTIMQVKNEMNNQTVFVRVVGPIPPTGDNEKLILKISKKAYDRLGAVDNRFPVEVSYIP